VDLACAQVAQGHAAAIGSSGGDFDDFLAAQGVETFKVDHQRRLVRLVRGVIALRTLVRVWRPDVVHAHMVTSALLARPVCTLAGIPLVTTVHNEFEKSAVLMGLATRVIAVSRAVRDSMQRRGVAASRLAVVLNGTIGAARLACRSRAAIALDSPAVVFVGGLHPRKGLPDLLGAFNRGWAANGQARLYVVGDGPHRQEYTEMVGRMRCAEAVVFVGAQEDAFSWMLGADIFVLASLADPAPLVLSEAREAGCAVVATRVGGIPELLEDGRAGILVPPGDADALASALVSLLSDPEQVRLWRARSQLNIEHLRIERVARETTAVYEAACQTSGRAPWVFGPVMKAPDSGRKN